MPGLIGSRVSGPRQTGRPRRRWRLPRRARRTVVMGLAAVALLLALQLGTGGIARDWGALLDRSVTEASLDAGFRVEEVLVTGRQRTPAEDLLAALGVRRGDPILAFDPEAARQSIEALPWVESAVVERLLPDGIRVRLVERQPMALWQNEQQLRLIDGHGRVLAEQGLADFADLPLTVGPDAPQHTGGFLALLSDVPAVADRVDAMVRVGGRRWDLKLDNGIDIRLPEDGVAAALERLAALQQDERLLDRDIAAIDMRLADRLVIRPRPAGGTAAEDGEGTTGDDGL